MMGLMLQKGAYSKDMLFVEQLLTGLVAANAIKDVQSLSQAPGMFSTVHRHLLKAGTLPSDGKPSLHMSTLVGLNPLQVRDANFNPVYLAFLTVMLCTISLLALHTLVGCGPLQVREANFNPKYLAFLSVMFSMLHKQCLKAESLFALSTLVGRGPFG